MSACQPNSYFCTYLGMTPFNPRRTFDPAGLEELAASIRRHGILEPLVVHQVEATGSDPAYELIAGERRWRAARLAGLDTVPVRILMGINDEKALELAMVENLQREDLTPIEEAEGLAMLRDQAGHAADGYRDRGPAQPAPGGPVAGAAQAAGAGAGAPSAGELTASHGDALQRWHEYPALQTAIAGYAAAHRCRHGRSRSRCRRSMRWSRNW